METRYLRYFFTNLHNFFFCCELRKKSYKLNIIKPAKTRRKPVAFPTSEEVEKLWKKPKFTSRILNFIFDEGHCFSQWGKFRKEYLHVGSLRYLISDAIPIYVASATLPASVLLDVVNILCLQCCTVSLEKVQNSLDL